MSRRTENFDKDKENISKVVHLDRIAELFFTPYYQK